MRCAGVQPKPGATALTDPNTRKRNDMSAHPTPEPIDAARLLDTQRAFDSVAADYDGPRGNNALIQRMRQTLWDTVLR